MAVQLLIVISPNCLIMQYIRNEITSNVQCKRVEGGNLILGAQIFYFQLDLP